MTLLASITSWIQSITDGIGALLLLAVIKLIRVVGRLGDVYESYMGHPATELADAVPSVPKRLGAVEGRVQDHEVRLTKLEKG